MEVHIGVGSGSADDAISYEGYFFNTVVSSTNLNEIECVSITASSNVTITGELQVNDKITTRSTATEIDTGGIEANLETSGKVIVLRGDSIDQSYTAVYDNNTFSVFRSNGTLGGLIIDCLTDATPGTDFGFKMNAYASDPDSGSGSVANGVITLNSISGGSGSGAAVPDAENTVSFQNNGTAIATIKGTGRGDFTNGGIVTKYSENNVSTPPTGAEMNTAFGNSSEVTDGFIGILNDAGADARVYTCLAVGDGKWAYSSTAGTGYVVVST
jgi:hypothetical protein